ncbi:uncharacterized protein P884DRAFT_275908 [Thermothelomyces heterothallicus CBS 202.75]|uniref:uncharacterized protein n=1 Tax=Thermothelomyces heterothallicus CBS 202.75 TaxID=1149848 RepID=UPI0037441053
MSKRERLRVLVAGASIAGPTAAYWLANAGARVTIVERFPHLRTNGQNVDIRTVGVSVMRKMPGFEAAVRAKTVPMDGISFVDAHGRPYATIGASGNPDQQSLVSEYEILRGDLARILFDMTEPNPNITYVFGEQIASLSPTFPPSLSISVTAAASGPVTVKFANGRLPTQEYDLVVAADGAGSRTRALALGCSPRDHTRSLHAWAAYFRIPRDLLAGSRTAQAFNAPGGLFVALGPHPQPDTTQVTILRRYPAPGKARGNNTPDDDNNHNNPMRPFREAQRQGDAALRAFVAAQLPSASGPDDPAWKCPEIASELLAGAPDLYASEMARVRAPALALARGRVALVGDAGYASGATGMGTSLALAGAYVLAGEVARRAGAGAGEGEGAVDVEGALRAYEEVMWRLVAENHREPKLVHALLMPQTALGLRLRNRMLAFLSRSGLLGLGRILSAGAFKNGEEAALPDYEWVL